MMAKEETVGEGTSRASPVSKDTDLPPKESLDEATRRIRGAQVVCAQLAGALMRSVGKRTPPICDIRQLREGVDFTMPPGMQFNPKEDEFDQAWLNQESRRLVSLYQALVSRVEYVLVPFNGDQKAKKYAPHVFTVRLYLL